MKMAKRLLLGSAAGLVAVGGAQSAELPAKAAPVQYVKICTLYGEGFYYIPGSDTCLKFGGYVRAEYGWNGAQAKDPGYSGTMGAADRTVSQLATRHRAALQVDTRTQTDYGTLRTFISIFASQQDATFSNNVQRAFIQWSGFTFGHAQSFQDTWAITDAYKYATNHNNNDTGANGINQIAYTWELGNGMTLTAGADEVRRKTLINFANTAAIRVGAEAANSYRGQEWPDSHLDFKVNQEWGYYALSGVVHDVAATYYDCQPSTNAAFTGTLPPLDVCGTPKDRVGWQIATGAEIKLDFISPGDHGGMGVRYAQGASAFGAGNSLNSPDLFDGAGNVAVGWMSDGVYFGHCANDIGIQTGTFTGLPPSTTATPAPLARCGADATQIQLTTTWTVEAAYEHYWTPQLKTSWSGGYTQILYNNQAKNLWANAVCQTPVTATQTIPGNTFTSTVINAGFNSVGSSFCDPDWGFLQYGTRTQWSPIPGFYMGLDLWGVHIFSAFKGATAFLSNTNVSGTSGAVTVTQPIVGSRPAGFYHILDENIFGATFRVQRQFNAAD
jgi:hypothetical protein